MFNGSGTYTSPSNSVSPAVSGTTISPTDFNALTADLASAFNLCFIRDGRTPMSGTLLTVDGSVAAPAVAFNSESSTGIYRVGAGQLGFSVGGAQVGYFTSTGLTLLSATVTSSTAPTNGLYLPSANTVGVAANSTKVATFASGVFSVTGTMSATSSITGTSVIVTGSTVPANGLYLPLANELGFATNTTQWGTINSLGNWTINTPTSGTALTVNGSTSFTGNSSIGGTLGVTGAATLSSTLAVTSNATVGGTLGVTGATTLSTATASGQISAADFNTTSDLRLKKNITPIIDALKKIESLTGVSFQFKDSGTHHVGLIAQDVLKVVPEAVKEVDGHLTVAYGNLVGVLVEAVKELKARMEALESDIRI